jgi:hypothetical protein
LAEGERGIFNGVMRIDLNIASSLYLKIETGMLTQLRDHVIEEWHPGIHINRPSPINRETDLYRGLFGAPLNDRISTHSQIIP